MLLASVKLSFKVTCLVTTSTIGMFIVIINVQLYYYLSPWALESGIIRER